MRTVRLWSDYPRPEEEAKRRIRAEIGANHKGLAYVDAPDGKVVEVDSDWLYQHFFEDYHPEKRWRYVPAVRIAIEEADGPAMPSGQKGRSLYSTKLEVDDGQNRRPIYFATFVDRRGNRFGRWVTTYPTTKWKLERLRAEGGNKTAGNPSETACPHSGTGNPTTALVDRSGASRSGRPPGTVRTLYHRREKASSAWGGFAVLGVAALFAIITEKARSAA